MRSRFAVHAALAATMIAVTLVRAEPAADEVLTAIGLGDDEKQRVMKGEYVTSKIGAVSDRDLSFAVAFLIRVSPDALAKEVVDGTLVADDPQIQAHGLINGDGSPADFAGLTLTAAEAKAIAKAGANDAMNWSTMERATFQELGSGPPEAVKDQLTYMLIARYQAYRAAGLGGIAPYDRGKNGVSDVASDLYKASEGARGVQRYMPELLNVLFNYPQANFPGLQHKFLWLKSIIRGKPTYVLAHVMAASQGTVRAVVRREFYVSGGYNAEQSVAGFLPVDGGTIVVCMSHAFTDQVAGAGGDAKRSIGSRVMAGQMKEIFDRGKKRMEK